MSAQHTPGPWVVAQRNYEDITVMAHTDAPRSVCDIVGRMPVDRANASLIAAAPDLLAVANGCLGFFDYLAAQEGGRFAPDEKWLAPLKAAIAKAEGRQ